MTMTDIPKRRWTWLAGAAVVSWLLVAARSTPVPNPPSNTTTLPDLANSDWERPAAATTARPEAWNDNLRPTLPPSPLPLPRKRVERDGEKSWTRPWFLDNPPSHLNTPGGQRVVPPVRPLPPGPPKRR